MRRLLTFCLLVGVVGARPKPGDLHRPPHDPGLVQPVAPGTITLSWDPYTNCFFIVQTTTNFQKWEWLTNVPNSQTNVTLPADRPFAAFRVYGVVQEATGGFWLQSLSVMTNTP